MSMSTFTSKFFPHTILFLVFGLLFSSFEANNNNNNNKKSSKASTDVGVIDFFDGSFDQVLNLASKEGRCVFVHTTSRHCSACSSLAGELFQDGRVADYYNDNFINYELNLDDLRYANFARIHDLGSHPVMLYFNPKGHIVKKEAGINNADEFINAGAFVIYQHKAPDFDVVNYESMRRKYDHGYTDAKFLYDYAYTLKEGNYPFNSVVNQYLTSQEMANLAQEHNRKFIYDFSDNLENNAIEYFLSDLYHFKEIVGGGAINEKIKVSVYNTITTAIRDRDSKLYDKARQIVEQAHLPNSREFLFYIDTEYYQGIRDWNQFAKVTIKYIEDYNITDPELLNSAAYKMNLYVKNKSHLKQALKWIQKSIKIENEYYNNLTHARILSKLERCKEAMVAAARAIDLAKKRDINYLDAARLLDNLQSRGC